MLTEPARSEVQGVKMHRCGRPLCIDSKCCSVGSSLSAHSCYNVIPYQEPACGCSVMSHSYVTNHSVPKRCLCGIHFPLFASVSCEKVDTFPCLWPLATHTTVLARRQHDGFYYLASVKQEEEHGMFLVEFNKSVGEQYPTKLQKTEAYDIIQYFDALRHCIVPGDNVLAPWESKQVRYGPGTVILGLETRDPLQATEDEELIVSFWNGKKAKIPLGVAVWISPNMYWQVMERLHQPTTSSGKLQGTIPRTTTYVIADRFTSVPTNRCPVSQSYQHNWHYHPSHPHYMHRHCSCCCFPKHRRCTCCYDPKCRDWWPLSPTTTVYVEGKKEQESNESTEILTRGRESPRRKKSLQALKSSESEDDKSLDDEDDYDSDHETWLSKTTQSTMVNSGVNTDSSLWEKPRVSDIQRPEWKYWKHSQLEPFHRKPGNEATKSKSAVSQMISKSSWPEAMGSPNQSSLFETIVDSPVKRLTMKDVLIHHDFNQSVRKQAPPVAECLGESEVDKLNKKQIALEKKREKIVKYREWEQNRAHSADQNYSISQEAHRKKTLERLKKDDLKIKEQSARSIQNSRAKKEASEKNSQRMQTIAAEEKMKEQRRLDHLRQVREKIDKREFEKCVVNEQKAIKQMDTQRINVNKHYKEVSDKVFQTEQEMKNGNRKTHHIQQDI
uniref:DUF4537 domain-containing protein n=1 Tax=Leptobrachium leishanense TaxID=445787 RepID=A0A8C5LT22_9ANUR